MKTRIILLTISLALVATSLLTMIIECHKDERIKQRKEFVKDSIRKTKLDSIIMEQNYRLH